MSDIASLPRLAIFGAAPTFNEKLHVGRPNIGNRDRLLARINDLLDRRWLSNNGPYVQELERRIAEMLGVKHCVAMCNGTVALEIAIRALGLKGEVIIPSFTFVATAHALQWQEITPVFCDIDPLTHCIDPKRVSKHLTPRTTGIIGVHVWGTPCDATALAEIAERHSLRLMFDAAHAFGCSYRGTMVGGFGDLEVFSFHATKFVNAFEGGAIVTNDDELAGKVRLMKNFGFAGYDKVIYIGTNGKMTEVSAAMALTSLESIDEFLDANRRNYACYRKELSGVLGVHLRRYSEDERSNYQYIVLEIDEAATGIGRDDLIRVLWSENVMARRYFYPGAHRMEPYQSYFPHAGLLLPVTEQVAKRVLVLPTGTAVTPREIVQICAIIKTAISYGELARQRLSSEQS